MAWVLAFAALSYLVALLPLVHCVKSVHGFRDIGRLWGYAPNQFLFVVLFFPLAAYFSATSLYLLVVRVQPVLDRATPGIGLYDHWIACLLVGLMVTAIVSCAAYFYTAMSFDKLRPPFAGKALEAIQDLHYALDAVESDKQKERCRTIARESREAKQMMYQDALAGDITDETLAQMSAAVYIQVIQDPVLQRELGIMSRTTHALNCLQACWALFVAFCATYAAALVLQTAYVAPTAVTSSPNFICSARAVLFAVMAFAFYPICYQQQRAEIEPFTGGGSTVLPQVFSGALVIIVLGALISVLPAQKSVSDIVTTRILPCVVALAFGTEAYKPRVLRPLLGAETNAGTQVILAVLVLLVAVLPVLSVWPR